MAIQALGAGILFIDIRCSSIQALSIWSNIYAHIAEES